MQEITLENIPQQTFTISLGGYRWGLSFRTLKNFTVATVEKDGEKVMDSVVCVPNIPLLPYSYMGIGDFVFVCDNGEYPHYENFGKSVKLYWLDPADVRKILSGAE